MSDLITINTEENPSFLRYLTYQSYFGAAQNNITDNEENIQQSVMIEDCVSNTDVASSGEIQQKNSAKDANDEQQSNLAKDDSMNEHEKKLGQYAFAMSHMSSSISFIQIRLKSLKKQKEQKEKELSEKQNELEKKQEAYQKQIDNSFAEAYKCQQTELDNYNKLVKQFQNDYKNGKYGKENYASAFERVLSASGINIGTVKIEQYTSLKDEIDNLFNEVNSLKSDIENLSIRYKSQAGTIKTLTNSYNNVVTTYNTQREELLDSTENIDFAVAQSTTPNTETEQVTDVSETTATDNIAAAQKVDEVSAISNIDWAALYVEGKGINFNVLANLIKNPNRNETTYASWLRSDFNVGSICKKFGIEPNSEAYNILNTISHNNIAYTEITTRPVLKDSFLSILQTNTSLEMFASIDLGGDGFISAEEANKLVDVQNEYNEIISSLKNKDGKITQSSVENAIKQYKKTDGDDYNSIATLLQFALDSVKNKMQGTKDWNGKKAYGKGDFDALFAAEVHNRIKDRMGYTAKDNICRSTEGKKTVINGVDVVITRNAIISDYELDFFDKYYEENPDASRLDMTSAVLALIETNNGTVKNDPRNFDKYWEMATPLEPNWELAEKLNIELHGKFDHNNNFMGWFPADTTIYSYIQPDTGEETQITLCNVHNCDQVNLANNYIRTYLYPKYLLGKITKEQYDRARKEIYEMAWMTSPCHPSMTEQDYYEYFASVSNFDFNTEELTGQQKQEFWNNYWNQKKS